MEAQRDVVQVVHVDDEPEVSDLTATYLERHGDFEVTAFSNAESCLERLPDLDCDCIVSDYEMPTMTGIDLLESVREVAPDVPFILYTGKGSEEIASRAISAGVTDYLQKGVGIDQYELLANRILNAVAQSRAETRAAETERRLRELANAGTDILWMFTADWEQVLFINDAYESIWGRDVNVLRENPVDFLPGLHLDDRETVETAMERLSSGSSIDIEVRVNEREDFDRWVWIQGEPITDDTGDVLRVAGFARDVTARRQEEHRYQAFVEQSSDLITVLNPDGTIQYQSPSITHVLGYDPEDLVGELVFDYIHPDDRAETMTAFEGVLANPENPPTVQYRLRHADGTYRWLESRGNDQRDNPAVQGIVVNSRDITERKETEFERRRHEATLTTLHDVAYDVADADTVDEVCRRIVSVAEGVLAFDRAVLAIEENGQLRVRGTGSEMDPSDYGTMSKDAGIAGRTFTRNDVVHIDDIREDPELSLPEEFRAIISIPITGHGVFQAVSRAPDAFDDRDLELAELLVTHAKSALDRLAYEQELEQQNDRLEAFASVVSHDLRNPLNVAKGRLALLDGPENEHLAAIGRSLDRMDELIADTLVLAREGRTIDEREPVSIRDLAESCWSHVETRTATLTVASDCTVSADPVRLRSLFENLFRNSVEHAGPDVTVTIGSLDDSDGFYVEDDGPGIPGADRDAVFEAGYSTAESGTGVGLSIVQEITLAHGWSVMVTESASGGARFEFTDVDRH